MIAPNRIRTDSDRSQKARFWWVHGLSMIEWFRSQPEYRQRIYALLVGIILLTLPCYCTGFVLLVLAPARTS